MIALNSGFLDRSVHALDLAVRPWMLDLGQPMFDVIFLAAHIEHMRHVSCRRAIRVARRESELDPIVGEKSCREPRRTASVVVAQPCKICPIAHPSNRAIRMHHQRPELNISSEVFT